MSELFGDRAFQNGLRAALGVLAVFALLLLIFKAWIIFEPLIVSIFLAAALWPSVSRISSVPLGSARWRPPRFVAAALIYVGTLASVGLMVWVLLAGILPQADRMLSAYPQQTGFIQQYLQPFRSGDLAAGAAKVAGDVAKEATGSTPAAGTQTPASPPPGVSIGALAVSLFGGVATLVLVLVFTFFLLLDGDKFAQWVLMTLPRDRRAELRMLGLEIRDRVSRWVRAQFTYAAVSGILMATGMFAFQIPSPWLYGVLSAVLALLPGLGPGFAAVPAFLVALEMSTWQAVAVLVFGLLVYALDGTVLVPRIYGGVMQLPMFVVLVATLLGADLMGIWGAMIASPVAVAIQIVLRTWFRPHRGPGDSTA